MTNSTCKHPDGCHRSAHKAGWCSMHYQRVLANGEPGPVGKLTMRGELKGKTCAVEGCPDGAVVKGWCRFHYDRVRFTGEPGPAEPMRRRLPREVRTWTPGQKHRFYKYGLTPEAFEALLESQGRRCYICATERPTLKGWSVDHCHKTGVVRHVLCNRCNTAIGQIDEDPHTAWRLYQVLCEISGITPNETPIHPYPQPTKE